jgi:hypothetical protein
MATPKNSDEILEDNREITVNNNTASIAPASVPVEPVDEFTENEKELIEKRGWTPEQLRAVKGFDATKGVALEHYIKTFQKPEINEKALQRNRTVGILGDGIKLLGQMYGAHQGARIDKAEPGQSLTSYFAKREDEARNMYQKRLDEWKRGYYGAQMSDEQMKSSYLMNLSNQKSAGLTNIAEEKRRKDERTEEREWDKEKHTYQTTHQNRVFEENVRRGRIQDAQTNRQLDLQEKSIENSKDKTEIAKTVASARMNGDFIRANPGLFKTIKIKDFSGEETTQQTNESVVSDAVMAHAYREWLAKGGSSGNSAAGAQQNNYAYPGWMPGAVWTPNAGAQNTPAPLGPVDKVTQNSNGKPKFTF